MDKTKEDLELIVANLFNDFKNRFNEEPSKAVISNAIGLILEEKKRDYLQKLFKDRSATELLALNQMITDYDPNPPPPVIQLKPKETKGHGRLKRHPKEINTN